MINLLKTRLEAPYRVLLPSLSSRKHIMEAQPSTSLVTGHTQTTQNITIDSHSCALQALPSQPQRRNTPKYNIDNPPPLFTDGKVEIPLT